MDERTWSEYEQKHRSLKKKYRKQFALTWLYWTVYYAVTSTTVWLICFERYVNFLIYFFVINTMYSLFLTMRRIARLRRDKETERRALVEQAPIGRFQID